MRSSALADTLRALRSELADQSKVIREQQARLDAQSWHIAQVQAAIELLRASVTRPWPALLLVGARAGTDAMLRTLAPDLPTPFYAWHGEPQLLPRENGGTLVLPEVAALDAGHQAHLFQWLDRTPRQTQVVSTTALPLYTLVERGAFRADLYYRLNVLRIDVPVGEGSTPPADLTVTSNPWHQPARSSG